MSLILAGFFVCKLNCYRSCIHHLFIIVIHSEVFHRLIFILFIFLMSYFRKIMTGHNFKEQYSIIRSIQFVFYWLEQEILKLSQNFGLTPSHQFLLHIHIASLKIMVYFSKIVKETIKNILLFHYIWEVITIINHCYFFSFLIQTQVTLIHQNYRYYSSTHSHIPTGL